MENGGQRRICIFTSSNQNLEHPLPIHCLTPVEYVISFHFPHPHFEMSAGLRPYEAGRILSFSKQMLIGPLYVLVNDIYTVIVLLQHKVQFLLGMSILSLVLSKCRSWQICFSLFWQPRQGLPGQPQQVSVLLFPVRCPHTCHCSECPTCQRDYIVVEKHFYLHIMHPVIGVMLTYSSLLHDIGSLCACLSLPFLGHPKNSVYSIVYLWSRNSMYFKCMNHGMVCSLMWGIFSLCSSTIHVFQM